MAKINILSEEICNRIAAGEVIDRPYSVVKELVENSLDAGATEIEIRIERGGKELIEVTDNGCGIEKDDMRAAFFAHATSKISCLDDIDSILTLGFRGEALSTVAAVSKVELVSVTEGNEANRVECDGDMIGKVQPAAWEKGTKISVRNLFFNTPARAKFMKTDKKEEADITNFVTRYILGNPKVAFRYFADGKLVLQSYGGGLEEAIAQVYGASFLPQCFKIQAIRNDIKVYGFIGNQNFFKPNKSYQTVFLNGRYIVNQVIAGALINAYSPYAMKRQYPVYVLFLEVSPDTVDVNVHPNKADVRFVNNALVYGSVYKVVSSVLDGTTKAVDFVVDSGVVPEIKSTFADDGSKNRVYSADFTQTEKIYDRSFDDIVGMPDFGKKSEKKNGKQPSDVSTPYSVYADYEPPKDFGREDEIPFQRYYGGKEERNTVTACSGKRDYIGKLQSGRSEGEIASSEGLSAERNVPSDGSAKQQKIDWESYVYKGNLFNTFLIYEYGDEAYVIDQHAAHERLIYDSLIEKIKARNVPRQGMLVPYLIDLNVSESAFIEDHLSVIRSMGFDIEPFGTNAYRINEIPVDLQDLDVKAFFGELLSDLDGLNKISLEDVLKDKIATTACKHAIKGGMRLTDEEIRRLFQMMDGDVGLKCPHGRPVCVKLTKYQVEKMFKRIV